MVTVHSRAIELQLKLGAEEEMINRFSEMKGPQKTTTGSGKAIKKKEKQILII